MAKPFYTCLLRCADGSYYAGQTDDLAKRLSDHHAGLGGEWTRGRRPVELVWQDAFATRDEARAAEAQVKGWNRAKKEALIAGRFDVIAGLASRGKDGRALRDALLRRAPQERGLK
jgi:predicted GIY-YIG superfamily endonuclease